MNNPGVLEQLRAKSGSDKKSNFCPSFAINLERYEDNCFFVGVRLDTGERVRVYLREGGSSGKNKRPSVADFQNPREKVYCKPGVGAVQFDRVYREDSGDYSAHWANTIKHKEDDLTMAYCGWCQLKFVHPSSGEPYINADIVRAEQSFQVTDVNAFEELCFSHLAPKFEMHVPYAMLRFFELNDQGVVSDVHVEFIYPEKEEFSLADGQKRKRVVNINQTMSSLRARYESVYGLIGNPRIIMEFIPAVRMRPGPDTKKKLLNPGNKQLGDMTVGAYFIEKDAGNNAQNIGFSLTNVGIRKSDRNDAVYTYLSFVKPNSYFSGGVAARDIPTALRQSLIG